MGSSALTWGSVRTVVRLARFGVVQSVEFGAKLGAKTLGRNPQVDGGGELIRSIFEQPDRDGTWDQFGVVVDQTPNQSSGCHHAP